MSDLISRQTAIDAVLSIGKVELSDGDAVVRMSAVNYVLSKLPSAQPERKKGKWINDRLVSTNGGTYGVRRCSECEAYYQDVGYGWNYCPNCGADMRGSYGQNS